MARDKASKKTVKPARSVQRFNFDMARITHAKAVVDISTSTIRKYAEQGLRIYKVNKAAYFSKTELAEFIRSQAA